MMRVYVEYKCDMHLNPYDCPDNIMLYSNEQDSYGLIVYDGGGSIISISFCPWCGADVRTKRRIKRRLRFGMRASKHRDRVL